MSQVPGLIEDFIGWVSGYSIGHKNKRAKRKCLPSQKKTVDLDENTIKFLDASVHPYALIFPTNARRNTLKVKHIIRFKFYYITFSYCP